MDEQSESTQLTEESELAAKRAELSWQWNSTKPRKSKPIINSLLRLPNITLVTCLLSACAGAYLVTSYAKTTATKPASVPGSAIWVRPGLQEPITIHTREQSPGNEQTTSTDTVDGGGNGNRSGYR